MFTSILVRLNKQILEYNVKHRLIPADIHILFTQDIKFITWYLIYIFNSLCSYVSNIVQNI